MQRKKSSSKQYGQLATKSDVREIVTEIIDNFAIMVKRGFDDINERMVTKEEFNEFKAEMYDFKANTEPAIYALQTDMLDVKSRLTKVETEIINVRCDVTSLTAAVRSNWQDHEHRITRLEERVT